MTWLNSEVQRSQQAVEVAKASTSTLGVKVHLLVLNHYQHCYLVIESFSLCQAGGLGGGVKSAKVSRVVQDVLDSAVQQSLSDGGESCVCHICNMQLKNSTTLRDHIRGTHLAIKAHRCNICGESFQWPMQVSRHKKRVHGSDGNQLTIFQWFHRVVVWMSSNMKSVHGPYEHLEHSTCNKNIMAFIKSLNSYKKL